MDPQQSQRRKGANDSKDGLNSSQPALPPSLPVLPPKRQHILTPCPSHENLIHHATAKSAFFQRLPRELRRQIYISVYGSRTVHMDLRFSYPELPGPAHARLNPESMNPRDRTALPN